MDEATEDHIDVLPACVLQGLDDLGRASQVVATDDADADEVGIFLHGDTGELLRRVVLTDVDHLETVIPKDPRDGPDALVVLVRANHAQDTTPS